MTSAKVLQPVERKIHLCELNLAPDVAVLYFTSLFTVLLDVLDTFSLTIDIKIDRFCYIFCITFKLTEKLTSDRRLVEDCLYQANNYFFKR